MQQSKRMSFIEAKTNAILGLGVSWLVTFYGLPLLGIEPDVVQATWITVIYSTLSFARSYLLRRIFNRLGGVI